MSPRTSKRSGVLELAVLGLLHERPMHGYELRKRLNTVLGAFRALQLRLALSLPQAAASAAGWIVEDAAAPGATGAATALGPAGARSSTGSPPTARSTSQELARRRRPGRVGGRALRRPLRLLRADRRARCGCASWRAGAAGWRSAWRAARGPRPHPGAARQLHPRAPAARPGVASSAKSAGSNELIENERQPRHEHVRSAEQHSEHGNTDAPGRRQVRSRAPPRPPADEREQPAWVRFA